MASSATSLAGVLGRARTHLVAAGVAPEEAAIDVDLFARTILGWDRARVIAEQASLAPAALEPRFSEWIERRTRREPSAYIVGVREFWGLDFHVSPAVLIPRPETEFIVEEALPLLAPLAAPRVAEIGTGSGCLAVSLALEMPRCRIVASDVSAEALNVARHNARRHGVADRIAFVLTSYLDGVAPPFDLIMANPPYVKSGDEAALSRTVRHEPAVALFGGDTGLRDVVGVLDTAVRTLSPGGWLIMEFGYGQEDAVRALVDARTALRVDHIRSDLQGIPRTAVVRHVTSKVRLP